MAVDIRIETTEDLRQRLKLAATVEGLTYEEMLEELLDFRDDNEEMWERRHDDTGPRRASGAGQGQS